MNRYPGWTGILLLAILVHNVTSLAIRGDVDAWIAVRLVVPAAAAAWWLLTWHHRKGCLLCR